MISCKEYVEIKKEQLKEKVSTFKTEPVLVVIQVDNNPASNAYVNGKKRDAQELGIRCLHTIIDSSKILQEELEDIIISLNADKDINGIIVQLPIPDKYDVQKLQQCISPEKDVDGFRKDSLFKPCTPKGIIDWLKYNNFDFVGKSAVVIGRSNIVGKPLVNLLIEECATVTCCNSKTKSLSKYVYNADLVVSAIGKPKYFNKFDFNGVGIIVDVGINRDENGKLCGDVDPDGFESFLPNTYLTPVPGSIGLTTRLSLMDNVIEAYEIQNNLK
jgi:methylenetetrahydrofolate dehydrogenase (NADP+)/methenyltetrahydrofolate cyclohydrolase